MGFFQKVRESVGFKPREDISSEEYWANGGTKKKAGGLRSRVQGAFSTGPINTSNIPDHEPVSDFGGTRVTIPAFVQGGGGAFGALPKKTQRDMQLDERSLNSASVDDLMDILSDAHPDVSFGLWNFMRVGSSGYSIKVNDVETGEANEEAREEVMQFIRRLEQPNVHQFESSRSIDKLIDQTIMSVVLRGAGAMEMVLEPGYDDVSFLASVDPGTVSFQFENDRYVPYQNEETISLDMPTFLYEALDERIDDPYGRSPFLGAINMVMFQLQVLDDIKAVVHNQGYPRFDITILEEVLLKRMPIQVRNNEKEKQKWLNEQLNQIIDMYSELDPDDAFVHYNSIEVGMAGGGKGTGALMDPQKLMEVIDNMVMSGLKTLSTILGRRSTGNTESFAKMEIKLYMKGIEAVQRVVARLMSRALTLTLNVKGIQGEAIFKFEPVEIRTDLEKAQFEQIALMNYAYMRDQGWIDNDEASRMATGTSAVAEPDWEHMGKSSVKNKEGEDISGHKDEKTETATE